MRLLLILLATSASAGVLPVEDLSKEGAVQALQITTNDLYSVTGGTVTGQVVVASGVYVSSGGVYMQNGNVVLRTTGNGITFPDGTTQTTAATAVPTFVSSWTVNLAGLTVTQTPTAYSISKDSVTVTLSASLGTKVCCFGSLSGNGASNVLSWNFTIDGGWPSGHSATVGLGVQFMASSSERANVSSCYPYAAGALSGSHNFAFYPSCNTSNACTIGGASSPKTSFFCGVEQP